MESSTLKKKLSTYVSEKGQLRNVSEELLFDVLNGWEEWTGSAKDFYREIGFSPKQMAVLIGKAKKLKREGFFGNENFKEVKVETAVAQASENSPCTHIELQWEQGRIIRFPGVHQLIEFLEKAS